MFDYLVMAAPGVISNTRIAVTLGLAGLILAIYYVGTKLEAPKHESDAPTKPKSIKDIANINTSMLGSYDVKFSISVEHLMYQLIVQSYNKTGNTQIVDKLQEWNRQCNFDPEKRIEYAIAKALDNFDTVVDIAKQREQEPNFGIDTSYDYHNLPKTILYDDHFDEEALFEFLNKCKEDGVI